MIDVFVGALLAGIALGWLAHAITHHTRKRPTRAHVVETDAPLQPEDLHAIRIVLRTFYQAQLDEAYQQVLAQVAAEEAATGVDAVEDAANGRWTA